MSTARDTHPVKKATRDDEQRRIQNARIQAALDAGGLDVRVDASGEVDPEAFADAVMKRWPRVMAKLGE
ncbi:hypothetical protein [Ancylobacter sp. G4_0304]|uniref:hypothetical protein n=1 Tax=Ancylobacter sp. G4_0304 TaxID=3114289 RepID=UPI0039C621AC